MSDYIISIVIAFVAIATPLALVPLLDLICPLSDRSHQEDTLKALRFLEAVRRYTRPFCEKVGTSSVTRAAGLRKP